MYVSALSALCASVLLTVLLYIEALDLVKYLYKWPETHEVEL